MSALQDLSPPTAAEGRAAAPPRAVAATAAIGLAAAAVVPAGPPGAGLVLLGGLSAAVVLGTAGVRLRGWRAVHGLAALVLLAVPAARDAGWVVAPALLAAAGAGALALVPTSTWTGLAAAPCQVVRALLPAAGWLARGGRAATPSARRVAPLATGLALTAGLLAVVLPLLRSADPVFAAVLSSLLPDLPSAGGLPGRLATGAAAATVAGAALLLLLRPGSEPELPPARRAARRAEWLPPLLGLVLALAGFVAVQMSVLLGGADTVLRPTGVTYSSHLHEGFWQLLGVTAVVLAVVAAAVRWAPATARPLLAVLCGLTLLVDASALQRLVLYVEAYGLSRLRVLVAVAVLEVAAVLVLVLVAGAAARRRPVRWLPHAVALSGWVAILVLAAADPDARIAESALARGDRADLAYLATLSADAVPVLDRLPAAARGCVLPREVPDGPWSSANLGRARAADVLAARPPGTCLVG